MKVVFLDAQTLAEDIHWPEFGFDCQYQTYPNTRPEQVAERIADAHIVMSNKVPITESDVAAAAQLKHIAIPATGFNHVPIEACQQRGITVSHIKDYAEITVPEHCIALLFALKRSLIPYHLSVKAGRWQAAQQFCYFDYPITQIQGATLGIIGAGRLGRGFAHRAEALGMQVLFAERKGQADTRAGYTPFEEVLARSDVISLHCPLTAETSNLLDDAAFEQMRQRPVIINTSRGGLIDPQALVQALQRGQISGAALDVVEQEPPDANHPYMTLLDRPDFILTPHVAWANRSAMQHLVNELVKNLQAHVRGQARNLVA